MFFKTSKGKVVSTESMSMAARDLVFCAQKGCLKAKLIGQICGMQAWP